MSRVLLLYVYLLAGCSSSKPQLTRQKANIMQEKDNTQISEKFRLLARQWSDHCQAVALSSKMSDYLNDRSYRELVELGPKAIPYIMERYRTDDAVPWEFLLDDITGLHMIRDRRDFSPPEVKKLWFEWWEKEQTKDAKAPRR